MRRRRRVLALAAAVAGLALTAAAALRLEERPPDGPAVPPPPPPQAMTAQALGDAQLAFRARSLQVQHLGTLGGRTVPVKEMDYARLAEWFRKLDELDPRAEVVAMQAAFLYSGTPRRADVRHLVDYLAERGRRAPETEWRWMTHAVYLARYRLEDDALALSLAEELAAFEAETIPLWARALRVMVLRDMDRIAAAQALAQGLLADGGLSESGRRWLLHYLERGLGLADKPSPRRQ